MAHTSSTAHHSPDLVVEAELLDLDQPLTAESPFRAFVQTRLDPTPLNVELHTGFEIGVMLEGAHERRSSEGSVMTSPGDVWLVAMFEPHGWRIAQPTTTDLVVVFLAEFLGEEVVGGISWLTFFAAQAGHRPRVVSSGAREKVLVIAREMAVDIENKPAAWETAVRLGVLRLLVEIRREWEPPGDFSPDFHISTSSLARVMPAVKLVRSEPDRRVVLREAADACALSQTHFQRIFRSTMGLSFGRFCTRTRIALVARRLLTTDRSEHAIAGELGFCDASHLHRTFVKYYGRTPGEYRQQSE